MAVELTKRRLPAEYVTRSVVLGRGWTQGAIARFLAAPDGTMANQRYRGSPPTRLYALARVQAVEGTREWQEWFFTVRRRGAAAPVVDGAGAGGTRKGRAGVAVGPHVGAARDAGVGRDRASEGLQDSMSAMSAKSVKDSTLSTDSKGSKGEVA
ncbi:hypothetical protein [Embleya sp. NPDC059259]|uniref:hypothetical protein n=1 Tax=unclassified Embleya TaxID=2699296 RepID=UPI003689F5AC